MSTEISKAAAVMGRKGGLAGKGKRHEAAKKASRARWLKVRQERSVKHEQCQNGEDDKEVIKYS